MTDAKIYTSATAFRRALEDRLKNIAGGGMDLARLRKSVAFERLLARFFADKSAAWLLKGGYALEMRYRAGSRSTKDMDFSLPVAFLLPGSGGADPAAIQALLESIAAKDLDDWFEFRVGLETQELVGAPYGGYRFPVEAVVDKRPFSTFHFDVAVGDAVTGEPEWVSGHEILSFAGIPAVKIALLPKEQHFAEKIHTYTFPRGDILNSRTRDLVDMVLLIQKGLSGEKTVAAVKATFARRKTHPVPKTLEYPPANWELPYKNLAEELGLEPQNMGEAFVIVSNFWNSLVKE